MKVAFITPYVVGRPRGGGALRLLQLQSLLTQISDGHAFAWDLLLQGPFDLSKLPHDEPPGKDGPPAGTRFHPYRTARDLAALALHVVPSFIVRHMSAEQRTQVLAWVDSLRPSHVVVEHPFGTELVPHLAQRGVRVFVDCQNVESDLRRQLAAITPAPAGGLRSVLIRETIRRWERSHFPLADQVWLPSEVDVARQDAICRGRARLRCVPNALDLRQYVPRNHVGSNEIVVPGTFAYEPNVVGARVLRDRVLPVVTRDIPEARIVLVGRDRHGWARALERHPDVLVTGEVPDTRPYLTEAGVVAVPVLHGSGTRYKILEALALRVPVVSTPLGCEGLDVRDGEHLLIRDIDGFAEAIVQVLTDPALGRRLAANGRALVGERYSWDAVERILRSALLEAGVTGSGVVATGTAASLR